MHASKVSHKILFNTLPWMHKARLTSLEECLLAAIEGRRLSVTGIGRAIDSQAKEKHGIKRADRLLSNHHLYAEREAIYHTMKNQKGQTQLKPIKCRFRSSLTLLIKSAEKSNNGKAVDKEQDKSNNGKHLGQEKKADKANNGKANGNAKTNNGNNNGKSAQAKAKNRVREQLFLI